MYGEVKDLRCNSRQISYRKIV